MNYSTFIPWQMPRRIIKKAPIDFETKCPEVE